MDIKRKSRCVVVEVEKTPLTYISELDPLSLSEKRVESLPNPNKRSNDSEEAVEVCNGRDI